MEAEAERIRALIGTLISKRRRPTAEPLADGQDLLADGALDSLAFVEMLVELQAATGVRIDFLSLDPEELTTLDTLTEFIVSEIRRQRS